MKIVATIVSLFCIILLSCQPSQKTSKKELLQKTIRSADLLLVSVQELRGQVGKRIGKDSNDVSKVFLPILSKIEAKAVEIKKTATTLDLSKREGLVKLSALQQEAGNSIMQAQVISSSLDQVFTMVLASDISFETGKYQLSVKGADVIENYVNVDIRRLVEFYEESIDYKSASKMVRMSVSGFADAQGSKNIDKRVQSNLLLSQKRADAVKAHLDYSLGKLRKKYKVQVEIESLGFGEALPSNFVGIVTDNDPQRRICRISGLVYPDFESIALVKK